MELWVISYENASVGLGSSGRSNYSKSSRSKTRWLIPLLDGVLGLRKDGEALSTYRVLLRFLLEDEVGIPFARHINASSYGRMESSGYPPSSLTKKIMFCCIC